MYNTVMNQLQPFYLNFIFILFLFILYLYFLRKTCFGGVIFNIPNMKKKCNGISKIKVFFFRAKPQTTTINLMQNELSNFLYWLPPPHLHLSKANAVETCKKQFSNCKIQKVNFIRNAIILIKTLNQEQKK